MKECKHNWNFVDGLTKRIRCTRCAAMKFVVPQEGLTMPTTGYKIAAANHQPTSLVIYNGGNPCAENEVMRLSAEGVKVNPKFTVDEATGYVIKALDVYLKGMAQKEYERGVIDGQAKIREGYERRIAELKHYEDLCDHANYQIGVDTVDGEHCVVVMRDNGDGTTTMVAHGVLKENT